MKFVFFHLMPYPYLPDDFDSKHPSPSLTFPNRFFDPQLGNQLYHRYLDELEHADTLGFDGIGVNEHHQTAYGLMPSPNIMAAALARRTQNAQIMVLGNAIGIRGNPLRVAEEIAMLDHLTNGRLASGFVRGIGWEHFAHSIDPTRSRDRFTEAHDLIIKAWTSDELFQWISPNYEYRYVNIWPRPLQKPHPPIYIPGAGSTETMKFVAEKRYTYMSVYAPSRVVRRWFDTYRQAAGELGYVPHPEKIGLSIPIYVAETDERAHREARPHLMWLFHRGLKQGPEIMFPPGYMTQSSMRGLLMAGMKPFPELTYEEIISEGYAIVGSPDSVANRIGELQEELGFGLIIGLFSIGDITHEQTVTSMELFAGHVIPAVRSLGAEVPEAVPAGT
ncbi:MAG TPA: LLM class flavin-dependent oxidoreductase [Actinophytocola sp.]|uniref:LLM class flavin-dependent oxidoreductase n=1 Tax=Actinophytocola sp. TaxID=1872138 RepID=UPI002DDD4960|nr:LLM class flavin-dependent oxidoreductase [Actinophytocola sp.]HEV2778597.1 LLM class flavin-dependent oxidoreductase [Actinophytocola sp.]